jgi:RHH-type proline utilization regulon transcriptional repressor/proline dehydrogenase/delta 1-pyrroline-5-carboxylate dehydrogenase
VLAKPAEATPLIAARATALLHEAGVPNTALQLCPARGSDRRGAQLPSRIDGVAFTGSTATAQAIHRAMAANLAPDATLIAETGGLNAMIVDSTALPEQAVRDIIASAFQSAGQRCSALRCLYLQEDVADSVLKMLFGAMDELGLGDPWDLRTDIGPVIDAKAPRPRCAPISTRRRPRGGSCTGSPRRGRAFRRPLAPSGCAASPIWSARSSALSSTSRPSGGRRSTLSIAEINATGYGLTFGLHTRIDTRVEEVARAIRAGNVYVNRNQIGAVVGSQPFGGTGLSGTGPKAGGPAYVERFCREPRGRGGGAWPPVSRLKPSPATSGGFRARATGPDGHQPSRPYRRDEPLRHRAAWPDPVPRAGPRRGTDSRRPRRARQGCPALAIAPGLTAAEGVDGTLAPETARTCRGSPASPSGAEATAGAAGRAGGARRTHPAADHRRPTWRPIA